MVWSVAKWYFIQFRFLFFNIFCFILVFVFLFKDHAELKPIISIVADICDTETIEEIFDNVDVVFHCAAFINFQFPPNMNELERVNVNGKLIYTYFNI